MRRLRVTRRIFAASGATVGVAAALGALGAAVGPASASQGDAPLGTPQGHFGENPVTDQDVSRVLERTEAASNDWMQGVWSGYQSIVAHDDDVSIYGPFGGGAAIGFAAWDAIGRTATQQFRNGRSKISLVHAYASGDLLVLVLLEEQSGEIGGVADQPWSLRVTQVYRREAGEWRVVHRHADPLTRRRTLPETAALASG